MELTETERRNALKFKKGKRSKSPAAEKLFEARKKKIVELSAAGYSAPAIIDKLKCARGFVYEIRRSARRRGLW